MSRQREAGPIPRLLLLSTLVCPLLLLAAADPKSWAEAVRQADQLLNAGNYDASLDTLAIALDMAGSSSHTALTLLRIGSIDFELGRFRDAERAYLKALALWTKPGPPKLDRSEALIGLGGVYLKTGELAKAERYARLGLQSREETLGPHHIDLGGPLQNLAAVYQAQHRYAEAKDLFSRAIVLLESGTGDRRGIAAARGNLAMLLAIEGDFDAAIQEAATAVSIWQTVSDRDGPQLAVALNVLAAIYCRARRWPEAQAPIQRAQEIIMLAYGGQHPTLEPILRTYAEVLARTGHKGQAKQMLQNADEIIRHSALLNLTGYTVDANHYRAAVTR